MMLAGTLGAREAGIAGVPLLTGTASGIRRYITEKLITDPSFLKTFQYALENGIPSRTAGPLLAARIISSFQNQPLKRGKIPQEITARWSSQVSSKQRYRSREGSNTA